MNRENYQVSSSGHVSICDGLHDGDNCAYRPIMAREMDALVRKAALFNVLAARIEAGTWTIPDGVDRVTIAIRRTGERVHGATLAEAVEKAMEAENAKSHTCPVCDSAMDSPPVDHEICGNCETHFGYHDAGPQETWQERIELLRRAYAERAKEKAMEAEAK